MAPQGFRRRGFTLVLLAVVAGLLPANGAAADATAQLPESRPDWATPANESGSAPDHAKVVFSVWLGWRN